MALTITRTGFYPSGSPRPLRVGAARDIVMVMGKITFDSSYDANGEPLNPADIGLSDILHISFSVEGGTSGTLLVGYDYTNKKVIACTPVTGQAAYPQAASGTNLSAWSVRYVAFGPKLK